MKKITKATVKSFIRKNAGKIYVKVESSFSGMTDAIERIEDDFDLAKESTRNVDHTFGIEGAWFVGHSRDYCRPYEDEKYNGFYIHNACGSFVLAIQK